MLQNICKAFGCKKIMVYNTPNRENGRYTISDSWPAISFSSRWDKFILQNHNQIQQKVVLMHYGSNK